MRPLLLHKSAWGFLTLMLVALPLAQAKAPSKLKIKGPDRADLRAKGNLELFGGPATPEYLDFKARVAERELLKWERLIPGTKAQRSGIQMAGIPEKTWVNIGPSRGQGQLYKIDTNIADTGRPTVILPHPTNLTTLYVGYAGGGLWRCTNADVAASGDWTWTPLTDALPAGSPAGNLSVGGAAFKVGDPTTIYMALGDSTPGSADATAEGRGFFISTDGGDNWTRGGTLGATTRVKTVLALAGNVILVAGNAGLFRSTDGGNSFAAITSGPLAGAKGWDLLKMANGDLVMAYQGADAATSGVAYSTDNGVTWAASTYDTSLTTYGFGRIALAANSATMYGLFEDSAGAFQKGIMKSTDSGRTWAWLGSADLFNVSGDGDQAGYNHMIAVDPANVNTVFVGTNLSMYRTLNGGVSWERMTQWMGSDRHYLHADYHVHAWAPSGPKALYVGTDGGLAVVRNPDIVTIPTGSGGLLSDPTFIDNRRNRNITTQLVYHIGSTTAATPVGARDRVIVGLQDQGTRLRTETGVATQSYDLELGGDGFGCLIHPYNGDKMLGSVYYTDIQRTTNGGANWADAAGITGSGSGTTAPFFTRIAQDMTDPTGNRVYTYTKTVPFVSTDFGANWTAMPTTGLASPNPIRHIVASPLTPNHVAVALNGGRLAITTNGTSWTTVVGTAFPGSGSYMNCVAFDTADAQILYASSVAFSATSNHIWKSINGGTTWVAVDGTATTGNGFPFGVPVHMVKVDPIDHTTVYAGTDLGLYRSTDSGATWARFGIGLPLVSVRDIYIAPDGTFMRIGTHGRGVWEMEGVTTNYAPRITAQPRSSVVSTGQSATFSAAAVGLPAPTFQWQVSTDGTTWTGITTNGTSSSYTVANAAYADSGKQYRVVATNIVSSVTSSSATLTVQALGNATTASSTTVTAIPDSPVRGTPGPAVDIPFTVSGVTGNIGEVTLSLFVTHTWLGDLECTLVAPDDSSVVLANLINGGDIGMTGGPTSAFGTSCSNYTVFSDLGTAAIQSQTSANLPLVGTFTPSAPLSAFNGKTANGIWKLRFRDLGNLDTGSFQCGVLSVRPVVIPTGPSFDINADGVTDSYDLLEFLKRFGSAAPADLAKADFNSDGQINNADLTALLAAL